MTDTKDGSTDWEPNGEDEKSSDGGEPASVGADEPVDDASTNGSAIETGRERSLAEYVQWGLLAILLLLTLVATLRFYFAASTAVDRFVTRQYRPLFQAAFNLVILLAAGVGLSVLVRRLS